MGTEARARGNRRRWVGPGLLGVAACLLLELALGAWSRRSGEGLVILALPFEHPAVFGGLLLAALVGAAVAGNLSPFLRVTTLLLACLVGVGPLPMALLGLALGDGEEVTADRAAPGRPDRHLVVEEGMAMIDPYWNVYVEDGSWPTERRWRVGYFNGDAGANALVGAEWDGPDRIRLTTGDKEVHLVDLTPAGRPSRTLSRG
ncbi:hypothetical protein [Kitasatospora camelliae]|uniref:Uncharacterized protein n=1 Tax=Kitasatospora camelliae TaxID=3156397 RepID=A0AAU8K4C4_9ACTN